MNEEQFNEFLEKVKNVVERPLKSEFVYQNQLAHGKPWLHANAPSVAEEILMISEYTNKARTAWTSAPDDEPALDVLRKITAMSLRCLANHGCKPRNP